MALCAESFHCRRLEGDLRKPLVVQGAREVGRTTPVTRFAATTGRDLLEVNLERHPELGRGARARIEDDR